MTSIALPDIQTNMRKNLPEYHTIFDSRISVSLCGYLSVGQLINDELALRALFACESGLSEPEIGLEHAYVLFIWQKKNDKWQNSHGARLQKQLQTALILSVTFI
jgi:hypothetical protein